MGTASPNASAADSGRALRTARAAARDPRSLSRGVGLFVVHVLLYFTTLIGAVANFPLPVNLLFAVANGLFIALLFIIGHDGCHGSFVPRKTWNVWLARLAFVPCVHSASLWRRTHNELHHHRTNLKGVDSVWAPMTKEEYDTARPWRRWLERLHRGPFGPLVYYYTQFWLYRLVLPVAPEARGQWKRHLPDSVLVLSGFALTLVTIGLLGSHLAPARPLWRTFLTGWAIPFAVWNYVMGLTIYLNHTHPDIVWFRDERSWSFWRANVRGTAHVKVPRWLAPLYADALAHTAHHSNTALPVYALPAAQADLGRTFAGEVPEYALSWAEYRRIYRACKLFDFDRACWTDFEGRRTSATGDPDTVAPREA